MNILGLIMLIYMLPITALSIKCYQCTSSTDINCNEEFDAKNTNLLPTECNEVYQAKFCVKTTGIYGGLMGTQRFCSSRDMGNSCEYVKRNGDKREHRSCVYTCYRDECNAAKQNQNDITLIFVLISIFIKLRINLKN